MESCCIPGCNMDLKNGKEARLFDLPKEPARVIEWEQSLSMDLSEGSKICEKHFDPQDVKDYSAHYDLMGNLLAKVPFQQSHLPKNAVPRCEPFDEPYNEDIKDNDNNSDFLSEGSLEDFEMDPLGSDVASSNQNETVETKTKGDGQDAPQDPSNVINIYYPPGFLATNNSTENKHVFKPGVPTLQVETNNAEIFAELIKDTKLILLPRGWFIHVPTEKKHIAFVEINLKLKAGDQIPVCNINKCLICTENLDLVYSALGTSLGYNFKKVKLPRKVSDLESLVEAVKKFSMVPICEGVSNVEDFQLLRDSITSHDCWNLPRHSDCDILTMSDRKKCGKCISVKQLVKRKKSIANDTIEDDFQIPAGEYSDKELISLLRKKVRIQNYLLKRSGDRLAKFTEALNVHGVPIPKAKHKKHLLA